tara:strand:- start:1730 stop:2230 length:501 start_codon:yes stop_codon:yes gene_type:complete
MANNTKKMKPRTKVHSKKKHSMAKQFGGATFVKNNTTENEYKLQKIAFDNNIPTPRPLSWVNGTFTMEKVNGMSVSDFYGDTTTGMETIIKNGTMNKIRKIVNDLRKIEIMYPDITGYNFMINEDTGDIYVVDFGHAFKMTKGQQSDCEFIINFTKSLNEWNPNFR